MQCDRAPEFFSDYLERTLDRPMTVALEAHLGGCGPCRDEIETLQATFMALDALPEVEPPVNGAWEVMRRLRGTYRINGNFDIAVSTVLEAHRARQTRCQLAMNLRFGGARTDRTPCHQIGNVLRRDHIEKFATYRHARSIQFEQ